MRSIACTSCAWRRNVTFSKMRVLQGSIYFARKQFKTIEEIILHKCFCFIYGIYSRWSCPKVYVWFSGGKGDIPYKGTGSQYYMPTLKYIYSLISIPIFFSSLITWGQIQLSHANVPWQRIVKSLNSTRSVSGATWFNINTVCMSKSCPNYTRPSLLLCMQ